MRYNTPLSCRLFSVSKAGRRRCAKRLLDRDIQNQRILSINLRNAQAQLLSDDKAAGILMAFPDISKFSAARLFRAAEAPGKLRGLSPRLRAMPVHAKAQRAACSAAKTASRRAIAAPGGHSDGIPTVSRSSDAMANSACLRASLVFVTRTPSTALTNFHKRKTQST